MTELARQEPKIYAFADESITPGIVICAAAVFSADRIVQAVATLAAAKLSVGLPPDVTLHCRVIFSGDARRGTPWKDVKPADVYAMVERLCQELKRIGHQPVLAVIDPRRIPPQPVAPGVSNRPPADKGIATMAYNVVFDALLRRFGNTRVRVWIDPDKTKIPWGLGRQRADSTRRISIELEPGKVLPEFIPEIEEAPKPRLLEVADLYAYVGAQAHSQGGGWRARWFRDLYGIIQPVVGVLEPNQNPQWVKAR